MSSYTAGPLSIIRDEHEDAPLQIGLVLNGECVQLTAEVYGRSVEEMAANARLYAAAPRVLERLRWHAAYFEQTTELMKAVWPTVVTKANEEALKETRGLIAEVEGSR